MREKVRQRRTNLQFLRQCRINSLLRSMNRRVCGEKVVWSGSEISCVFFDACRFVVTGNAATIRNFRIVQDDIYIKGIEKSNLHFLHIPNCVATIVKIFVYSSEYKLKIE